MKIFTPAQPGSISSLAQLVGIFVRGADEEGVIDPGPALGAGQLVLEVPGVERVGIGVRHLEDRRDAAQRRPGRAARQVFLMGQGPAPGNAPGCR